jgi:DnaJ-class molecular chaperone
MEADRDTCQSCIGTGIGNPHVERSVCSTCGGSGVRRPDRQFVDEDRWAWNHFDPEPGDEDACGGQEDGND